MRGHPRGGCRIGVTQDHPTISHGDSQVETPPISHNISAVPLSPQVAQAYPTFDNEEQAEPQAFDFTNNDVTIISRAPSPQDEVVQHHRANIAVQKSKAPSQSQYKDGSLISRTGNLEQAIEALSSLHRTSGVLTFMFEDSASLDALKTEAKQQNLHVVIYQSSAPGTPEVLWAIVGQEKEEVDSVLVQHFPTKQLTGPGPTRWTAAGGWAVAGLVVACSALALS